MMNQNGSMTIIALMLLAFLTLIGIGAYHSTTTEINISRNELTYSQNLYRSDAAVAENANSLQMASSAQLNDLDNTAGLKPSWLHDRVIPTLSPDISEAQQSKDAADERNWSESNSQDATLGDHLRFFAVHKGIAAGESIDITKPDHLHEYTVYGRSTQEGGQVIIQIGYKRRVQRPD